MVEATNETEKLNHDINRRENLFQVFKQHETIYVFKTVIYIVMVSVIIYDMQTSFQLVSGMDETNQSHHMFTAFVVLLMTTLIDEVVLSANCRIKSELGQGVQYAFMIIVAGCLAFGALIFFDVVPVVGVTVVICYVMSGMCCASPLFEMVYDFISRIQDETDKKILET